MARMHSRDKGKSGSKRPLDQTVPEWVTYSAKEVEAIVVKLAKEGNSTSQIGIIVRDTYGVPSIKALCKKSVLQILAEKGETSKLPEDLQNLIRRSVALRKHMDANITDRTAKRGIQLTESKIRRLTKYYKSTGKLEKTWNYNPKQASFYLE